MFKVLNRFAGDIYVPYIYMYMGVYVGIFLYTIHFCRDIVASIVIIKNAVVMLPGGRGECGFHEILAPFWVSFACI